MESDVAHQEAMAKQEAESHANLFYVGRDKYGGHGLFARGKVNPEEVAIYYRGVLFQSRAEHSRHFPEGSMYALATREDTVWDSTNVFCMARFVNQGTPEERNAFMEGVEHTNVVQLLLSRTIQAGEEVLIGYGNQFDPTLLNDVPQPASNGRARAKCKRGLQAWLELTGLHEPTWHGRAKGGSELEIATPIIGYAEGESSAIPDVTWACKAKNGPSPTSWASDRAKPKSLVASDGLVLVDGEYKTDWSRFGLEAETKYPSLLPFLEDEGLEFNAMARDTPEDPRHIASQSNEAAWIQRAKTAEWCWGTNIVMMGFVENSGEFGSQQVFLDTLARPLDVFHFRTRSGRAGLNRSIMGSFVVVESWQDRLVLGRAEPPLVQIDNKHGFRIAGRVINGTWVDQHHFKWRGVPVEIVHPRYSCGDITMDSEGEGGQGTVFGLSAELAEKVSWKLLRARVVGGPGGLPVYSPKRRIRAEVDAAKLLPHPTAVANREDYTRVVKRVPHGIRTRAIFENWDAVFRSGRYDRIRGWMKRHAIHLTACEQYAKEHGVRFIEDGAYAIIAKHARPPATLCMDDSDLIKRCRGMRLCRLQNGLIQQMFDDDGPLTPGAVKPEAVLRDHTEAVPWTNARMFQNLAEGWLTPKAHERGNSIVLRPYPRKLYQGAAIWKEEREKGLDINSLATMFFPSPLAMELTCIPFITASRSHVEKEKKDEWRQIVNMSLDLEVETRKIAAALNVRLRAARELEPPIPNLELVKGTDVAQSMAIFRAFGLKPKLKTWDASQFFHCFGTGFMQSTEAGILGPDGVGVSVVLDMGREDSPRYTQSLSSYIAESVGGKIHEAMMLLIHRVQNADEPSSKARSRVLIVCALALNMVQVRGAHFGTKSRQARLDAPFAYVDDLAVVVFEGLGEELDRLLDEIVSKTTSEMGLAFLAEKNEPNVFIGQRYELDGDFPSQHIKKSKVAKYLGSWRELVQLRTIDHSELEKLTGRLVYGATAHLELKAVAAVMYDCASSRTTSRLHSGCIFKEKERAALQYASDVLTEDVGLPLLPRFTLPKRGDPSTICIWSDACLNEEDGYNGWGFWILIPNEDGPPTILAIFDTWSKDEEAQLGHNVPLAEALIFVLALRAMAAFKVAKGRHDSALHFTDSQGGSLKFASLKAGSIPLDATRACWNKLQERNPYVLPTWIIHTAREFNTGSDMLSKGRWALFCSTLAAAGLSAPTRLTLSAKDRDVMDLIMAKDHDL